MSFGKKIIGSVAVATVLWAGATAYISSNTKEHVESYIEKSNKLYEANGMKLTLLSFEKGFLNSTAKLSMNFTDPTIKEELKEILKLPMTMDYNIENGPVLFQNGLTIGASRINSNININNFLVNSDDLEKIVKEDIIFNSNMKVDFSNHIIYDGSTNTIIANADGDNFVISPIKINGEMDAKTFVGTFKLLNKSIKGTLKDGGELLLENIALDGDITKIFGNGFYLGDFKLDVGSINVKEHTFPIQLKNASMQTIMSMKQNEDESLNMNFTFNVKAGDTELPAEADFAKELSLSYGIDGTRLEAWIAFQDTMKTIQSKQQAILKKLENTENTEEQMAIYEELQTAQESLQSEFAHLFSQFIIKDKTTLKVETVITDKSDVKSNAAVHITYIGDEQLPTNMEELSAKVKKELLNWVKLDANIELQKSLVDKLPQAIQQQLAMAMMTGMLKDNKTAYNFDANYVPKKLTVNGEDKSDMLMLVEMGLNSGM